MVNRLSSSSVFRSACVVLALAGSADATEVERHGIGMPVALADIDVAVDAVAAIDTGDLDRWARNLAVLPPMVYATTNEPAELGTLLREVAANAK